MARFQCPSVAVVCMLLCCLTTALATPDPRQREDVIQKRSSTNPGRKIELTAAEGKLNNRLIKLKQKEMESDEFPPAEHFYKVVHLIHNSPIFRLLQKMPKGGALHIHDFAMVNVEWLVKNVTHRPHCYMCYTQNESVRFKFSSKPPKPLPKCSTWKLMEEHRNRTCSIHILEDRIRYSLVLFIDKMFKKEKPDEKEDWFKFEDTVQTVLDLITYAPVFRDYYYQGLTELYKDNIMYLELRALLPEVYELDGTVHDKDWVMKTYEEVTKQFQADHPDFYGAKIIYSVDGKISKVEMATALEEAMRLQKDFPDTFGGFDMAVNTDRSRAIWYVDDILEMLDKKGPTLPYFFHGRERNPDGSDVDLGLLFAMGHYPLRVGNLNDFSEFFGAVEKLKESGRPLELCPVSNQVLKVVKDLRGHPVAKLMFENHPIVISSDYPAFFGISGLSYDFYEAFVGIGGAASTLTFLKQWAMNSIRYSSLSERQREEALDLWEEKWNKFVSENTLD